MTSPGRVPAVEFDRGNLAEPPYSRAMSSLTDRLWPRPVAVFAVLTLLIWTNRVWLAWTNPDDTVAEKLVWSTPITLFVIAAAFLLVQLLTERGSTPAFGLIVRVFAAATVVYWAIRMTIIVTGDHG